MMERKSGILMHITSLPSPYGIGTFGKEAYDFVDFLVSSSQKYWQVLPMGPTGIGDSPYQSFSSFAGNPYFIDLDFLNKEGILKKSSYENMDFGSYSEKIDYGKIFINKMKVLRMAYENTRDKYNEDIKVFKEKNKIWLEDYAMYMALKSEFNLRPWKEWDRSIKFREKSAVEYYRVKLNNEINYWIFIQYVFLKQWTNLKNYANERGIKIIGDIPIYAAEDSADTWANSKVFMLDDNKNPLLVSGCPPDAFSSTGQLWGNPVYNWNYIESTGYKWWIDRMRKNVELYDVVRIDHFRGFESYWEIPYGNDTAVHGKWVQGPGMKFFHKLKNELGNVDIIAEDLGYLTEEVKKFRAESGYPGMKVLEFAFNFDGDSDYLPHNHIKNCVVYIGTHDNEPIMGWLQNVKKDDADFAKKYLRLSDEEGYNWGFIRGVMASVAKIAIVQMQDYIGLGNEGRMNTPATIGENWCWRIKKNCLTGELEHKISDIVKLYRR